MRVLRLMCERTGGPRRSRLVGVSALVAIAAVAAPPSLAMSTASPPASEAFATGVASFLEWAHPPQGTCSAVERIEVVTRWAEGLRVRFETPCGDGRRSLGAVLETREGAGVWQVSGGFEMQE